MSRAALFRSPSPSNRPLRSASGLCPALCLLAVTLCPVRAPAGGERWTSAGPAGVSVTAVAADPYRRNVVFAGTAGSGIFKSTDAGLSWRSASTGMGSIPIEQVVAPYWPDVVFATSPSHGVFRSSDAGETWLPINDGLPSPAAHRLAADPRSETLYVTSDAGVYVSHDLGAHWSPTALRTKGVRRPSDDIGLFDWVDCLLVEPSSHEVYACYFSWRERGPGWHLLRSSDDGDSWHEVPIPGDGGPVAMSAIYYWPWRTELYVATYDPFSQSARVLRSFDGGDSWKQVGDELPHCDGGCGLNGFDVTGGGNVYVWTDDGVFAFLPYNDGPWRAWNGMDDRQVFAIDEGYGSVLAYAATDDGVFTLRRPPACSGDCNGDGTVAVAELVGMVDIAVGRGAMLSCTGGDANGDGQIAVDDVVAAVTSALQGCPATP